MYPLLIRRADADNRRVGKKFKPIAQIAAKLVVIALAKIPFV